MLNIFHSWSRFSNINQDFRRSCFSEEVKSISKSHKIIPTRKNNWRKMFATRSKLENGLKYGKLDRETADSRSAKSNRALSLSLSLSHSLAISSFGWGDKSRRMVNSADRRECIETRNPKSRAAREWARRIEGQRRDDICMCASRSFPVVPMNKQIQISAESARRVNHRRICYTGCVRGERSRDAIIERPTLLLRVKEKC